MITIALATLAGVILGAWISHTSRTGRSPMPDARPLLARFQRAKETKDNGSVLPTERA